jgi:hypothetical protein
MPELAQPLWLLLLPLVIAWAVWSRPLRPPAASLVLNHPGLGLASAAREAAPARWPLLF